MKQLHYKTIESKVDKLISSTLNQINVIKFDEQKVIDLLKDFKANITDLKSKINLEIALLANTMLENLQ
jgi:hypothetical protein